MLTVTKRAARVGSSPTGNSLLARIGKLYLVDLAGSERLKKSMSTGACEPYHSAAGPATAIRSFQHQLQMLMMLCARVMSSA